MGKDAKADKTKEEMAKEAAELAKELGMNISFDSDDNDFSIVDDSGNVVVSTKAAVKNTGFRLNSLVYTGIAILAVLQFRLLWRSSLDCSKKTMNRGFI